jgi:polyferredoxin
MTGIFFGRVYCGFLCPFGVLQEFLHYLSSWDVRVDPVWDHRLKKIKYFLLWLIVTAALVYPAMRLTNYETFALTFALHGTTGAWCLATGTLAFSFFIEKFYCRYFCLVGASLGLLNKISLSRLVIAKECGACRSCEALCPTQAINNFKIDPEECVLCNRCRGGCAKTNIRIVFRGKTES